MDNPYAAHLPNLRALYLPDPGYALVEADLARADAQVIAWEADAANLKDALRRDLDIHSDNARDLYGNVDPHSLHTNGMSYRDNAKRWVHATNFAGGARTVASVIVLPEAHVRQCQERWCLHRHPAIGELHRRVNYELTTRKHPTIRNRFGFRRVYTGGDRQSNLLGQALAWIAQSTVACVINTAMLQVDCARQVFGQPRCGHCLKCDIPEYELLLQVHDSLLGQVPLRLLNDAFIARLTTAMCVTVPYDDPLVIPCEIKHSDRSWGEMQKWSALATAA